METGKPQEENLTLIPQDEPNATPQVMSAGPTPQEGVLIAYNDLIRKANILMSSLKKIELNGSFQSKKINAVRRFSDNINKATKAISDPEFPDSLYSQHKRKIEDIHIETALAGPDEALIIDANGGYAASMEQMKNRVAKVRAEEKRYKTLVDTKKVVVSPYFFLADVETLAKIDTYVIEELEGLFFLPGSAQKVWDYLDSLQAAKTLNA